MSAIPRGLKAAQDIARAIVAEAARLVTPGVTEIALSAAIDDIAARRGASGFWSPTTSRVGLGTLVAHPDFPMQERAAAPGDTCIIDVACTVQGWYGDYCETVLVPPAPEAADLVDACQEVSLLMRAQIRPGMPAAELFHYGAEVLREADLKLLDLLDNFGHSIGTEFAADGFIDAGNDTPMYGGWTIEPHVGRRARGAKFEDIIWLDRDGSVSVV
jgi:Xaa-Pro dipeptidase